MFLTSKFEMHKIKNKYIGYFPKLVFGHFYVVTSLSIEKQHFTKDKMCKQRINVTGQIF